MTTPNMGRGSEPGIGHPDDPMTQIALQGIVRAGAPAVPSLAAAPQIAASMNKNNVVPMTLQWAGTPPQAQQVGGGLYTAQELGRMDPQTRQETMTQLDPSLLDAQARRSAGDAIVAGMAHSQSSHLWEPGGVVPPVAAKPEMYGGGAPLTGLLWYALGPFLKHMKAQTAADKQWNAQRYANESPEEQAHQRRALGRRQDEFFSVGTGQNADRTTRAAMQEAGGTTGPTRINLQQFPPSFDPPVRHRQPYGWQAPVAGGQMIRGQMLRDSDVIHEFPVKVQVGNRTLHIGSFQRTINDVGPPPPGAPPFTGGFQGPPSWHFFPAPNVLVEKNYDPRVLVPKFVDYLRANNMDDYAMEFAARPPQTWWTR